MHAIFIYIYIYPRNEAYVGVCMRNMSICMHASMYKCICLYVYVYM